MRFRRKRSPQDVTNDLGIVAPYHKRLFTYRVSVPISCLTNREATASLGLAGLSLFRTTGPAMAVAVMVTMAASLTLTPAVISLVGPRTVARVTMTRRWKQTARLVARHPAQLLAGATTLLLLMAAERKSD